MDVLLSLLSARPYLTFPQEWYDQLIAIVVWMVGGGITLFFFNYWRNYSIKWTQKVFGLWLLIAIFIPVTSLFLGIRLSSTGGLPPPNVPIDPEQPSIMLFASIPWVLAAGLISPAQSFAIAGITGILLTFWGTHNIFTPWIFGLYAIVFSVSMHQRYRTTFFRVLRHPLLAGLLLSIFYPVFYLLSTSFLVGGSLAVRLDYAITHTAGATYAFVGSLFIACVFAEIFSIAFPSYWGSRKPLIASPAEKSLEVRFLYTLIPLMVILAVTLVIGTWQVAGKTSRKMVEERLSSLADVIGDGIPYFLNSGQTRIMQMAADDRLYSTDGAALEKILQEDIRAIPFFNQIYILNIDGNSIAGYPHPVYDKTTISPEEQYGILRALDGIPFQFYASQPPKENKAAYISFIAALFNSTGEVQGVLVGLADLSSNPLTEPLIANLNQLGDINGQGILLDENGRILYHPYPGLVMSQYVSMKSGKQGFFEETGSAGTRQLVLFQEAAGWPWTIVLSVPFQQIQQNAIVIASPIAGMVLLLFSIATIYFHLSLRNITTSLSKLAGHAGKISQGLLDHAVIVKGEDEVAGLGKAFEQMRLGLKLRLEEQDRLLWVSQGVASSLDLVQSLQPVLFSALDGGACCARVILTPEALPELEGGRTTPVCYALGPGSDKFAYLDDQILKILKQQERIVLTRPNRPRYFQYPVGCSQPEALLGMALHHESLFYGSLWLAFDREHIFTEDEVRFVATLAGHAASGVANSRHYLNAEVGRRRLEAIINSTPDPVLVIDQQNRLLLDNPAASQALNLPIEMESEEQIDTLIPNSELVEFLQYVSDDNLSKELTLPDGKVYYATLSNILAEGKSVGRVCLMRDVTHFKDLDKLKTEFVNTVSHDLRSPLSLMKGYATMLEMVGNLNEQQESYLRKILSSVEMMTHLIGNLLDIGRIEAGVGLRIELLPVRELLELVVSGLQMQAAQKRLHLSLQIPDEASVLIEADRTLINQALQNLIENAIKYTDPGGEVTVSASLKDNLVMIEVRDTGIGIAYIDQMHVFDKFYRVAQPGGKRSPGSGLGLAIVKSIAEQHGGEVGLESQLGKGSKFSILLPLRQEKSNNSPLTKMSKIG